MCVFLRNSSIHTVAGQIPAEIEEETETATEGMPEPETEPVTEAVSEPETEPVTEPASKEETEPVTEEASEQGTEPVTEPASETESGTPPAQGEDGTDSGENEAGPEETKPGETENGAGNETETDVPADETDGNDDTSGDDSKKKGPKVNVVKLAAGFILPDGTLKEENGKYRYALKKGGYLKDAWVKIGSAIYYFNKKGYAQTGEFEYRGRTYFFGKKGRLFIRRFRKAGNNIYYYGKYGGMFRKRWLTVTGNGREVKARYFFQKNGVMARSKWIRGCYFKANGVFDPSRGTKKISVFKPHNKKQKLIIIGASRVFQMEQAVGKHKNVRFISVPLKGYKWFAGEGVSKLQKLLADFPKSKVVIQLGNNDIRLGAKNGNFDKYVIIYRALIRKYPKAHFYFMDILPFTPESNPRNRAAISFNRKLKKEFPHKYIGGFAYLKAQGFSNSYDHAHYTVDTSRVIYNYILRRIS